MKILLVKVSALGDIIHALPVLAYLASCPEQPKIDWLVENQFASLLTEQPLINQVHVIDTRKWRRSWIHGGMKLFSVFRRLRAADYDLVIDLQGNSKSGLFTFFTKAPQRFGFDFSGVREWPNLLATNHQIKAATEPEVLHISEINLRLAEAALPGGHCHLLQGPILANPGAARAVKQKLSRHKKPHQPLVVLHYGTTWETKLWALDYWQQLTRMLVTNLNVMPLLTWGNANELTAVQKIKNSCPTVLIWPRSSLTDFIAFLGEADLVIGGDTGPIHIAAALGIPTISFYRATDHRRNGPRGPHHVCLQSPFACSPCLRRNCERNLACSVSIKPEEVLAAAKKLLKISQPHPETSTILKP